jgi:hypothetical protein
MSFIDKRKLFEEDEEFNTSNTVLTSNFFLNKDYSGPVTLALTHKAIFYNTSENRALKKGFMITFDTIFQILRPKYKPEDKTLGTPFGLRFLCPNFESQEFFS